MFLPMSKRKEKSLIFSIVFPKRGFLKELNDGSHMLKNLAVYPGRVGVKNPGGVGVLIFAGVLTPPGSR